MVCNGHTKNASSVVTSFQVNFLIKSWILMKEKNGIFINSLCHEYRNKGNVVVKVLLSCQHGPGSHLSANNLMPLNELCWLLVLGLRQQLFTPRVLLPVLWFYPLLSKNNTSKFQFYL